MQLPVSWLCIHRIRRIIREQRCPRPFALQFKSTSSADSFSCGRGATGRALTLRVDLEGFYFFTLTLETVIVSPLTSPVTLTVSPACCASAASFWLATL